MSGTSQTFRPAGPTQALSVVATIHTAVPVTLTTSDVANFVACQNSGPNPVAVKFSVAGTAAVLPVDGTPGDWVLPASMILPQVLPLPNPVQGTACQVTAIGTAAGPAIVYFTPLVMQH